MLAAENTNPLVNNFWQKYLETLPKELRAGKKKPEAWGFGDSEAMADDLGSLVVKGIKTATSSLFREYETGHEVLPQACDLSIILNGRGQPLCLIETISVEIKLFNEVDARFAYDEGEGDRSLEYWRQAHRRFFERTCTQIGMQILEDMPVVCEQFKVIYRP